MDHSCMDPVGDIPLGYRFVPTDQELIQHFLKKKLKKEPMDDFIPNVNIYNHSPQELAEVYPSMGENVWYFFTPRDRKYRNGKRPNRSTGNGYWKATIADKPIYIDDHVRIGFKKTLVFCPLKGKKTDWIMHEYVLVNHPGPAAAANSGVQFDDCVLCRIYKRTRGASNHSASCQILTEEQESSDHATHKRARYQHNLPVQQQQQQHILPRKHHLPVQQNYPAPLAYSVPITNQENREHLSWDKLKWQQLLNLANGISTSSSESWDAVDFEPYVNLPQTIHHDYNQNHPPLLEYSVPIANQENGVSRSESWDALDLEKLLDEC